MGVLTGLRPLSVLASPHRVVRHVYPVSDNLENLDNLDYLDNLDVVSCLFISVRTRAAFSGKGWAALCLSDGIVVSRTCVSPRPFG